LASNPYEILGVKQDATATEIRKAYRRLAKASHPDVNRGDKKSEERFKRISAAYDLLSDTEKRLASIVAKSTSPVRNDLAAGVAERQPTAPPILSREPRLRRSRGLQRCR
jgi:curved DNA-binding protein CbpA